MNKITKQLEKIASEKRMGLMTHTVAGCPSLEMSEKLILKMAENGADFIEIQIPFSDPVADGAVMMRANEISLENGTKVSEVFEMVARVSPKVDIPLLFMGYFNNVFKMGVENFAQKAREVGISGVIFPDIPYDEAEKEGFLSALKKNDLAFIEVVSENISDKRLEGVAKTADKLLYCTARLGITGTHSGATRVLSDYLNRVKKAVSLPLAVGFGVSSAEDVKILRASGAEIAVVGSAVQKIMISEEFSDQEKLEKVEDFLKKLL